MISIIVPVYKVEQYLPQCIESIINQTYQNLEIVLIDDGSPDNCGRICEKYAQKDKRIKVFHKENGGLSDARNYGIVRASGEYLAFVDSDDWIEPDMYEVLVNRIEDHQTDIVSCGFFSEFPKRHIAHTIAEKTTVEDVNILRELIIGDFGTGVWHKLFRKSCFKEILFPVDRYYEDIFIVHKLLAKVNSVSSVSKPLYHYRKEREGAITTTYSMKNLIEYWQAHKSRYDYFIGDSRFNTDKEFMDKLYYYCAKAIGRAWRRYYSTTKQEREEYASHMEEMRVFCIQNFPVFGVKTWPLHMRVSLFIGRFNNKLAFALLYYLRDGYRRILLKGLGIV